MNICNSCGWEVCVICECCYNTDCESCSCYKAKYTLKVKELGQEIHPICIGCDKSPEDIEEYKEIGKEAKMTPTEFVKECEGTYNAKNGHFLCTSCYFKNGMPSSPDGWICP